MPEGADDAEGIKEVFRGFDYKQSKTIPREKLVQVLLNLDPTLDRHALVNLLELSDLGTDEDVRYEEFINFVRPQQQSPEAGLVANAEVFNEPTGLVFRNWVSEQSDDGFGSAVASRKASKEMLAEEEAAEQDKIRHQQTQKRRVSVSAARISDDDMKDYDKPVYPKDEAAKTWILDLMRSNAKLDVLFGHLGKDAMNDVVNAFYAQEFESDTDIIQQGASGECLYIIADGSVEIFVARPPLTPGDKGGKVATWTTGALFGELALMYEAPRAATVTAVGLVSTWVLDGVDLKMLLKSSANAQLQKYEGWLTEVPILQSFNHF